MSEGLIWLQRPPDTKNLRMHPGLRYKSRIHTIPKPYRTPKDIYSTEQIKLVKNNEKAEKQELLLLNECKNLFCRQLPYMGNPYISRLVFDFNSETVVVLSKGIVTGSITARLFFVEKFVEIAFLAVESMQQGKSYGRLTMSYFKQCIQAYPFHDVLACADNDAVEFFEKLGFNKEEILIDPERWTKRIKDYTGVKLVYCNIMDEVDYMNTKQFIKKQTDYLEKKIGKHFYTFPESISYPVRRYPQQPTTATVPLQAVIKNIDPVQYDEELKDTLDNYETKMSHMKERCLSLMNDLSEDEELMCWFQKPVTEEIAPYYFDKINHPMDFLTIYRRLGKNSDFYKRPDMLYVDLKQIADNCQTYNMSNTEPYKAANMLKQKIKSLFKKHFPEFIIPGTY